jgi:hypothetical protein
MARETNPARRSDASARTSQFTRLHRIFSARDGGAAPGEMFVANREALRRT